jgi:hypothetical protein
MLVAAAFLGGFLPQWWTARGLRSGLRQTEVRLRLLETHELLGVASHEVQRNNFASAAEAAARFFDQCATLARSGDFANEPRTQVALTGYAQQRDEVMTQLASADPVVRERLATLYLTMHGVMERRPSE